MLKVNYLHVCDSTIFDTNTGKLSIIGILTNFNSNGFPAIHPSVSIVAGFESKEHRFFDVELEILDEKGTILKVPTKVEIGLNDKGILVQQINGYQIPRELTHKIKVNLGGETLFTEYLTINNK